MTTTWAVVVTMAVLTAAGALPVRMLAGWRPVTPFLAPIGGAILAGAAGALTVLVNGTEVRWFVPLAIAANAAASASWLARREARRSRTGPRPSVMLWAAGGAGVLAVAGASAWSLRSLVNVDIGVQARSIWLAHATWIANGHNVALSALTNSGLAVSHSSYPPLGGSAVALGWVITGVSTDRVGELVIALLSGCAVAAAGATILEVGLIASVRSHSKHALLSQRVAHRRCRCRRSGLGPRRLRSRRCRGHRWLCRSVLVGVGGGCRRDGTRGTSRGRARGGPQPCSPWLRA